MGQANAARNKLYDLRECKLDPKSQSGAGKDLSGAVFSEADFTGKLFLFSSDFGSLLLREMFYADFYKFVRGHVYICLPVHPYVGIDFREAQLSKVYARNSKFVNCDFTDGVVDRVSFDDSDLTGAIFKNAVLSGHNIYFNTNRDDYSKLFFSRMV